MENSRIIVKNLPNGMTEEKVRKVFSQKGILTDVQLKYTKDGKFRNFCFIGYETEKSANDAIEYFNNSCINTNTIQVELCSILGAETKPKSWSKYAKDSTAYKTLHGIVKEKPIKEAKPKIDSGVETLLKEHKHDPLFLEFMKVHTKSNDIWNNDILLPEDENKEKEKEIKIKENEILETKIEEKPSKTPDINFFTLKLINMPYRVKRSDIATFFHPLKPSSVRLPKNSRGFCFVGFKTQKDMTKALLKNKSFIKKNQIQIIEFTEKNRKEEKLDVKNEKNAKYLAHEDSLKNIEDISESGRIFFRNLSDTVQEEDLQKLFETYGPVSEISLPINSETKKIKRFGTVTFLIPENAVVAYNKLNGTTFHGRMLHLLPSKSLDKTETDLNKGTFKEKKLLKQKKNAENSNTWNSLFLGSNVVADLLASNYGKTKAEILDIAAGGTNAAVRLALGETEIVLSMKKYLEENGVCLDAFNQETKKFSKLIIIAKNLPANTTKEEIYEIFSPFGLIAQILLPPFGITAIIEFTEKSEARSAFKRLAYSKFKNLPLYLEWAPENTFKLNAVKIPMDIVKKTDEIEIKSKNIIKNENKIKTNEIIENDNDVDMDLDDNTIPENDTTLFIRNLNYNSTEETLGEYFNKFGRIHAIEITKKKDPSNPSQKISLGYGFVQFKKYKVTEKVFKDMQFTVIDGNQVELKRSEKMLKNTNLKIVPLETINKSDVKNNNCEITTNEIDDDEPAEEGATLFLRNLNYETREHTIREHFNHIGPIYAIDIAKKKDPDDPVQRISLGYGFIQFKQRKNADKALKEMQFLVIDGNQVELKRSDKFLKKVVPTLNTKRIQEGASEQTGTKILIKNIPFQAKTKEIQQLFKAFGGLKSVRVPKKNVGGGDEHRGFGFVEFETKSDAKKAFESVGQSTHLYGRRLALLWANIDENVDQLRKRTADHFHSSSQNKGNKKALFDTTGIPHKTEDNAEDEQ